MRESSGYIMPVWVGEAVPGLMWGRWREGSCIVDNRLSPKSGDNAESHLPGLREEAEWLGRGKLGGKPGLTVFRSSENLPNPWPK